MAPVAAIGLTDQPTKPEEITPSLIRPHGYPPLLPGIRPACFRNKLPALTLQAALAIVKPARRRNANNRKS